MALLLRRGAGRAIKGLKRPTLKRPAPPPKKTSPLTPDIPSDATPGQRVHSSPPKKLRKLGISTEQARRQFTSASSMGRRGGHHISKVLKKMRYNKQKPKSGGPWENKFFNKNKPSGGTPIKKDPSLKGRLKK